MEQQTEIVASLSGYRSWCEQSSSQSWINTMQPPVSFITISTRNTFDHQTRCKSLMPEQYALLRLAKCQMRLVNTLQAQEDVRIMWQSPESLTSPQKADGACQTWKIMSSDQWVATSLAKSLLASSKILSSPNLWYTPPWNQPGFPFFCNQTATRRGKIAHHCLHKCVIRTTRSHRTEMCCASLM